jgi:hypothetical protein
MSRLHPLRPMLVTAALACFTASLAAPAHADDRHRHGPPPRHWHRPHPVYVAPQTVYAPPPVVYPPPAPVAPGINLVIPFNFR